MNAPDCICSPGRLPLGAFCAGRDDLEREALHDDRISIRAPRAGCDFLRLQDIARALISIHAPRVGRDPCAQCSKHRTHHFNPRAPCGARQFLYDDNVPTDRFQSTRPVWGATPRKAARAPDGQISIHAPRVGRDTVFCPPPRLRPISIHAPRVGRDGCYVSKDGDSNHFNPRAPCGARHFSPT